MAEAKSVVIRKGIVEAGKITLPSIMPAPDVPTGKAFSNGFSNGFS